MMTQTRFEEILDKSLKESLNQKETLQLFRETENDEKAQQLFHAASTLRSSVLGNTFKWSAGIASVLTCNLKPHCRYCNYWISPKDPLSLQEIMEAARYIEAQGIREFHLSGGTTLGSDGREMVEMVRNIRTQAKVTSAITVNCGAALSRDSILELKDLGVTSISSIFETGNPEVFKQIKPGDSFEAKIKLAEMIGDAGLEMGSGLLAGLGTPEDYVDFMFLMKNFKHLTSLYVSRFFPFKGIPMEDHPRCSAMEGARVIAITRLVLRNVDIRFGAGWGQEDFPLWLAVGGGNNIIGVHINRVSENPRNSKHTEYHDDVEYRNTIPASTERLMQFGISTRF